MGGGPGKDEVGSLILVDSSVWIDYFNGVSKWQTNFLDQALASEPIVMGDLILTEVLQGFRSDQDFETAHSFLKELPFKQIGGYKIAVQSADNYRSLRKAGITVRKTIDVIIATFCIVEGLPLLHDDRDFEPISAHFPLKTIKSK
jgi:predicted nucleic acid-binding protein